MTLAIPQSMVVNAMLNQICLEHINFLSDYGPEAVLRACNEVAAAIGDVFAIAHTDAVEWVRMVESRLAIQM